MITAFSNQKGGVGKTTLARELGLGIAKRGRRTLLVDADSQGNLTKGLLGDVKLAGLYDALESGKPLVTEVRENLSILSGDHRLAFFEKKLLGELDAYLRFKELFAAPSFSFYDYILIDTPPSLGILTLNALTAADNLVIPMRPALYSMQGTNDLIHTIQKVRSTINPNLAILGVIINGFDSIPLVVREIRNEIEASFGPLVFDEVLSRSIKIEEAIALKKSIGESDSACKNNFEIEHLCDEFLKRTKAGSDEKA